MKLYRIKDWDRHFETPETMGQPEMRRVQFPNKHDGDGYNELVNHRHGAAYFGAWCALVQVSSKSKPRGTLIRDGNRPHDSASLARQTRLPKRLFDAVLPRLVEIGWLEEEELQGSLNLSTGPPGVRESDGLNAIRSSSSSNSKDRSDQGSRELKEKIALRFFVIAGARGPAGEWALTEGKLVEWQDTFPGVDVAAECRKARQWVIDNPTKRKTASGMPAFLYRWLCRAQNRTGGSGGGIGPDNKPGNSAQRRSDKLAERDYGKIGAESLAYDDRPPGADRTKA